MLAFFENKAFNTARFSGKRKTLTIAKTKTNPNKISTAAFDIGIKKTKRQIKNKPKRSITTKVLSFFMINKRLSPGKQPGLSKE